MNPTYWKNVIANVNKCPDGNSINCCADCLANLIHELITELQEKKEME